MCTEVPKNRSIDGRFYVISPQALIESICFNVNYRCVYSLRLHRDSIVTKLNILDIEEMPKIRNFKYMDFINGVQCGLKYEAKFRTNINIVSEYNELK